MIEIRELRQEDIAPIVEAFRQIGWNKPASQYEQYLKEQTNGQRQVLVAFENGEFSGYLTIICSSNYLPFQAEKIPEINDFNV